MSARDVSALPDDTLMARLRAGLAQAPEAELLAAADALTRLDPTPTGLAAPTPTEAGERFNAHRNRALQVQADTGLGIHDANTLANGEPR